MLRIIDYLKETLELPISPIETDTVQDCIVYKYYQVSRYKWRLEVRLIGSTFADADRFASTAISAINDFGDVWKIEGISSIVLNGGGVMKDYETNTIHRLLYFDVVMKG